MEITEWLGGFQGTLEVRRKVHLGPTAGGSLSFFFPRGSLLLPWSCLKCLHSSTNSSWSPVEAHFALMDNHFHKSQRKLVFKKPLINPIPVQ